MTISPEILDDEQLYRYARVFSKISDYVLPVFALIPPVYKITFVAATPGFLYNTYRTIENRLKTDDTQKAICLFNHGFVDEYITILGALKGQVGKFFTDRNIRVDYKHRAKIKDLKNAIQQDEYDHIVLMGHGNGNRWFAKDGRVDKEMVKDFMENTSKKPGYFIQFTCNDYREEPLGESVVEDPSKNLGYTGIANFYDYMGGHFKKDMGLESMLKMHIASK